MGSFIDLTGKTFGYLTAVSRVPGKFRWLCLCICGVEKEIQAQSLRYGYTGSCGCKNGELGSLKRTKHGAAKRGNLTREYRSWLGMNDRCYNASASYFKYYGGRGIQVCERWRNSFESFLEDMGPRPLGTSIERRENNGNYEPDNCHWATREEQDRNKRSTVRITFQGRTQCLKDWSRELGIHEHTLQNRLRRSNWSIETALTTRLSRGKKGIK